MNFKKELINLMRKYNIAFTIDIEEDYSGVQNVRFEYDELDDDDEYKTTGNLLYQASNIDTLTACDIENAH